MLDVRVDHTVNVYEMYNKLQFQFPTYCLTFDKFKITSRVLILKLCMSDNEDSPCHFAPDDLATFEGSEIQDKS